MTSFAERLRRWLRRPSQAEPPHPFDVQFGVETSGLYYADRLPSEHVHNRHNEGYYATAPSLFHGAIALWREGATEQGHEGTREQEDEGTRTLHAAARIEDYTFVDLGCGKGRVVLMASQYPFRAVRGIELSSDLARVAQRNVRKWMAAPATHTRGVCRDVAVECADVLEAGLPDGPVVLFLFNSFDENVLRPLMERLTSRPAGSADCGPTDLIYVHPDHDRMVAQTRGIELLKFAEVPFSEEDARADLFGVRSDMCSVYRHLRCG